MGGPPNFDILGPNDISGPDFNSSVVSINGQSGVVTGLEEISNKDQPSGYAGLDGSGFLKMNELPVSVVTESPYGVIADIQNLGPYNIVNSGAIGSPVSSGGGTQNLDHTALVQAYINAVSAIALSVSAFARAVIDWPTLHYRLQNVSLPGNVKLRLNGAVCQYVASSGILTPPSGPGNYVFRQYGAYNAIEGGHINGNGTSQPFVGGVWQMPAGAAGIGSARSYQSVVRDCTFDSLGGRAIYDQGVGNRQMSNRLAQNCLLSATNIGHFMGVFEQAGTDSQGCFDNEIGPSVVATVNGIAVPRCPVTYDTAALGSTNGLITLPLANATVTLTAAPVSGSAGGCLLIGGHVITYTNTSGVTITGATCADTGTIASGTSVFQAMGFVAAFAVGGANNWSGRNVCEFGDVGTHIGNSTKAHVAAGATLTTTANQTIAVDNACHLSTSAGTLGIPTIGAALSFPPFTYTSISETMTSAPITLSTTPQTLVVGATAGWPASGTFNLAGYTVSYSSIVDGTHVGGCTIASGPSNAIPSGTYMRSNVLNGCSVASGTMAITSGQAVTETGGAAHTRMIVNRVDFPRSHGYVITGGSGSLTSCGCITGPAIATNSYDAFHNVSGSSASFQVLGPWETSTTGTNRWRTVVQDPASSASSFCQWLFPVKGAAFRTAANAGTGPATVMYPEGAAVALTVNSTAPIVDGISTGVHANTVATSVTNYTEGVTGQRIIILQDSNTTIVNGTTIITKSGANIAPPASGYAALQFKQIFTTVLCWIQLQLPLLAIPI